MEKMLAGRRGEHEGRLGCAWMDERWETRAGQCSDAQQFGERLIFLVLCAPIQAGLLEQHMQLPLSQAEQRAEEMEGGGCSPIGIIIT